VILVDSAVVSDPEGQNLTHIMAHEIGHMVDFRYLDDETRSEFMQVRGFSQTAEWRGAGMEWGAQPQEDFAEVYAALAAPFSLWPIQTIGGRIQDPVAMSALMERFQSGPTRPLSPVSVTAVMSRADSAAEMIKSDQVVLPLLFAFAALYIGICSARAMGRAYAQGPARRRPSIETAIARAGAQPALVSARPRRDRRVAIRHGHWGPSPTG
jgi:Zn-dependent protease with chaperone function